MSTGISISSINRIKELAEEKKYAEALEILDTQNLDKSINPQFLRISGEIFRENKRYYDSRRILMKAHQMAPQGNRIIFELIQLYLELGYFSRAQRYYEQYLFYVSADDSQKDYVEYVMKKALGADVKELASILIPILEQMPEDRWNFEAVLLYDKMDRKDKALEESRYILENFKESVYVESVIDYIDDKLDVDQYFYIYPREEQEEDTELFGDLIEQEEKLLEADHLRMYPPEARIMVEAEDKDAIVDTKPAKEKKPRKKNKKSDTDAEFLSSEVDDDSYTAETVADVRDDVQNIIREAEQLMNPEKAEEIGDISEEELQLKQEREAALEKLLSKKIDTDKIKESAKQVAKAVKDIDTEKAKNQVKSVAESVKDNVKKATDVIGEAVGTKQILEGTDLASVQSSQNPEEQIVDGIIESVLEPPKRAVGQVVMNEELDALIPDSLEAMSQQEIADIEARKEEAERLELEALEASLQLEEQKKAKSRQKKEAKAGLDSQDADTEKRNMDEDKDDPLYSVSDVEGKYTELKEKFLAEWSEEEEQPLDSLGFISVVHSDIDSEMEEEIPDAAGMLRQMIDNKEFYAGEDSTKFESKASYLNHGFEVEDYDFEAYTEVEMQSTMKESESSVEPEEGTTYTVEGIYAQEQILNFDDIIPENLTAEESEPVVEAEPMVEEPKPMTVEEPEPIVEEAEPEPIMVTEPEPVMAEEPEPVMEEEPIVEEPEPVMVAEPEPVMVAEPEPVIVAEPEPVMEAEPIVEEPEPVMVAEPEPVMVAEPITAKKVEPVIGAEWVIDEPEPVVFKEPEPVMVEEPIMVTEPEPVMAEEPIMVTEPEPIIVEEPIIEEPEPMFAEPEPVMEAEPIIEEPEPIMVTEPEPILVEEPEPVMEAEPIIEEPEPVMVTEPEPVMAEEPIIEEPEPVMVTEPEPVMEAEPIIEEPESVMAEEPIMVTEPEPVMEAEPIIEEPEPIMVTEPEPVMEAEPIIEEPEPMLVEEPIIEEPEPVMAEEPIIVEEPIIEEPEPIMVTEPEPVMAEEPIMVTEPEPILVEEPEPVMEAEPIIEEPEPMLVEEPEIMIAEEALHEDMNEDQVEMPMRRDALRVKILLSDSMMDMLVSLKESR